MKDPDVAESFLYLVTQQISNRQTKNTWIAPGLQLWCSVPPQKNPSCHSADILRTKFFRVPPKEQGYHFSLLLTEMLMVVLLRTQSYLRQLQRLQVSWRPLCPCMISMIKIVIRAHITLHKLRRRSCAKSQKWINFIRMKSLIAVPEDNLKKIHASNVGHAVSKQQTKN